MPHQTFDPDLLVAADPARHLQPPPGTEDRVRTVLNAAIAADAADAPRSRPAPAGRRPRRRLVAVGGLAVAAVIAATVLAAPGQRLDVVAEAQAALAPSGEIVHMKITSQALDANGRPVGAGSTNEYWSAPDPSRWRLIDTPGNDASAPQQIAYANGEQREYNPTRDTLVVNQGLSDDGPAVRVPSPLPQRTADVDADLRSLLEGDVADEGELQADGRTVRRLVSISRSADGVVQRLVYDVEPETFAPIGATLSVTFPASDGGSRDFTTRLRVDAYERVPLDATTAKLLQIQTTPHTKTTINSPEQLRAAQQRRDEVRAASR
jgi:hypothetical protein